MRVRQVSYVLQVREFGNTSWLDAYEFEDPKTAFDNFDLASIWTYISSKYETDVKDWEMRVAELEVVSEIAYKPISDVRTNNSEVTK